MENTIWAKARYQYRSDTAENWGNANPILLAGEHGVVIDSDIPHQREKIGDGKTPWNELGWYHGPQGEVGPQGDKGDRGNPGVFIGSGDMPEDCNVQIDPDGDVLNFEDVMPPVDQTYNPESENAQSGIAVAEAMGFSLIGETVLTEDVQHILFTCSIDGTPLKDYKDFFLFFKGGFTTSENSSQLLVRANDGTKYFLYSWQTKTAGVDYAFWVLTEEIGTTPNGSTIYKSTTPQTLCGNIVNDTSLKDGFRIQGLADATKAVRGTITFSPSTHGAISKYQMDTSETSLFKEGSKFYLYGRKR